MILHAAVLLLCRAHRSECCHTLVLNKACLPFATMPQEFSRTLAKAIQAVQDNFNAAEHLPEKVFQYLLPISTATCQGMYATTMMFAAAMPALSNGASIMLWSQQSSPLAVLAFHVANAQKGKSRLFQAAETLFEVADDTLESMAESLLQAQASDDMAEQDGPDRSSRTVQVKSICLQSFTFTELFFRCSAEYPQVETTDKTGNKKGTRLWWGQALNLDEAYEFLDGLALLGSRSEKESQELSMPVPSTASSTGRRPSGPPGPGQHVLLHAKNISRCRC